MINGGYFYRSVRPLILKKTQKKKNKAQITPLSIEEEHVEEERVLTISDHWSYMKQVIQEHSSSTQDTQVISNSREKKTLAKLISSELMVEYRNLMRTLVKNTKINKHHPEREIIDIESETISTQINGWITKLSEEIKTKDPNFCINQEKELEAFCWMFFDSFANIMNAKSFEKDVLEADKKPNKELITYLEKKYPLKKHEIKTLVKLIKYSQANYSLKILVSTMSKVWSEYDLQENKKDFIKISSGYLLARTLSSYAPSLYQNILSGNKFNVFVFLEFFGLNKFSMFINKKTDVKLAKTMNDINKKINKRIANSLFFQEFEFIHHKSLGEVFATLERCKASTSHLIAGTSSRLLPNLSGIALSLGFLTKLNPILGLIGLGSMPIMYKLAKKYNDQIWPIYEKEKIEKEKISTQVGAIKTAFEEIKTSPATYSIANNFKEKMDELDSISLERSIQEKEMSFKQMIPFNIATVIAASIGGVLQSMGRISGGTVLANILYSNHLNMPIQRIIEIYFNKFSRYVQDIERMDQILGKYETLDLPTGKLEKQRVSTLELEHFDISIKNLHYKNILQQVNLNIKSGKFITLTGSSGTGKSTLLRNLVGLYRPTQGSIKIGGIESNKIKKYGQESIYSIMSYCNQSPHFFKNMSLRKNLLLWSNKEVSDERIANVLKDLCLEKFIAKLDTKVKNLSGGERRRIGIARVLLKDAKIILLDEPTANLDPYAASEIRKALKEIHTTYQDKTMICVTHDHELAQISDESINLKQINNIS